MPFLFALALAAGQLIENVPCASNASQTYTLYLPSHYSADRKWPLLLVFDPRGHGSMAAELFRPAAEEHGWIVMSSNNTQSDTDPAVNDRAVNALLGDVGKYAVDLDRVYAAGFSGTATVAWFLGQQRPLAGVIAAGAPWIDELDPSHPPRAYWASAGTTDFNYRASKRIDRELARTERPHHLEIFDGGHQWMPQPLATAAVDWMQFRATASHANERYAAAIRDAAAAGDTLAALEKYEAIVGDFAGLHDTTEARDRAAALRRLPPVKEAIRWQEQADKFEEQTIFSLVTALRDVMAMPAPPPISRIEHQLDVARIKKIAAQNDERAFAARRALEMLFGPTAFYLPEDYRARHEYARAATMLSIAVAVKPENANVQYNLARAWARAGRTREALDALDRAVTLGFHDRAAAETSEDLASLRDNPRFAEIAARMAAR